MSSARLNLTTSIQDKAIAPKISLQKISANSFCFVIKIWVTGKDTPPMVVPDPDADIARDIFLTPDELYIGEPSVTLKSAPGLNTSTMTIVSTINGKIPGTPDFISKK